MNEWNYDTTCASPLHYSLVMNCDPAVLELMIPLYSYRLGSVVAMHPSRIRDCQGRPPIWPFFSLPTIMGGQVEG